MKFEIEINLKYSTIDTSDSNTSEETVYCIEPIYPVTNIFFSDTDVILDSPPDSSDSNILPSAPPVLELNSKFMDTESTVQTTSSFAKFNSSTENSNTPTVAAQRPPVSPIPVAAAITRAQNPKPNHIPDPTHYDSPFQLPPPTFTKLVLRR